MPTAPAAPVLLTTPTGFRSTFSRAAATGRAVRSATPPGGNGATMVMGREGYGSAPAAAAAPAGRRARAAGGGGRGLDFFLFLPPPGRRRHGRPPGPRGPRVPTPGP